MADRAPQNERAPAPGSSLAAQARRLLELGRLGSLSTLSQQHPGWPFGSVMPYALDGRGRPLFLISTMAMHTKNLQADPRASLMVMEGAATGDPLAAARVTVLGRVSRVPQEEREPARQAYLARHPEAGDWVDFGDFAFYRMEIADLYYVGGFGVMGWVAADDYRSVPND
ncbi:MAG: pyridoxamine 5'-phosphate oxidase family protein [Nitrospirota bacterium]